MNKLISFLLLLFIPLGTVGAPNSIDPIPSQIISRYDIDTGSVHCVDKWGCLHESVHEYDWELSDGMMREINISATEEFRKLVADYHIKVWSKSPDEITEVEFYITNFPGVGADYSGDNWGGFHELYAEMFVRLIYSEDKLPEEFKQFYDSDAIYKIWEQYPNIRSMK